MKELIKIIEKNGSQLVSAKELYEFLGYNKTHWRRWYNKNIVNNEYFEEGVDYDGFAIEANGNVTQDFALTMDAAKEISMLAKTQRGKQARMYFIEVEKSAKIQTQKPLSNLDLMELTLRQMRDQENRLQVVESDISEFKKIRDESISRLKALPLQEEKIPELETKDKIRLLVNRISAATGVAHPDIWNKVYESLYYHYHISIKSYKKERQSESWLDVADRKGHLETIYSIVSNLVREKIPERVLM